MRGARVAIESIQLSPGQVVIIGYLFGKIAPRGRMMDFCRGYLYPIGYANRARFSIAILWNISQLGEDIVLAGLWSCYIQLHRPAQATQPFNLLWHISKTCMS
jgi:hypothetical protein